MICPVEGCEYTGAVASVAGHVSGKRDRFHDWELLGYEGANDFKRAMAEKNGNSEGARLLHIADTHIGKQQGGYGRTHWPVDCTRGFRRAIKKAIELEVDAVVHTGDLFHNDRHGISRQQGGECRTQLQRLDAANIPFYYILGDHERKNGARWFRRFENEGLAIHLTSSPVDLGGTVALYGADNKRKEWWDSTRWTPERPPDGRKTVLALHQSLTPLSNANRADCDVTDILQRTRSNSGFSFDVIVLGHLHKSIDNRIDGCRVVCGGATERLGGTRDAFDPFVGLLESNGNSEIDYRRCQLQ